MGTKTVGFAFLGGYVLLVGIASFLQKAAMKQLTPYQLNFLMALGMMVITVPFLWLQQKNLAVPGAELPLGGAIGLMMSLGSVLYVLSLARLPVGTAAAIASSYIVLVVVLSRVFLKEALTPPKLLGVALTLLGVAILSQVS
jgi:drug/metabolite transporter (DMT)-like permease